MIALFVIWGLGLRAMRPLSRRKLKSMHLSNVGEKKRRICGVIWCCQVPDFPNIGTYQRLTKAYAGGRLGRRSRRPRSLAALTFAVSASA